MLLCIYPKFKVFHLGVWALSAVLLFGSVARAQVGVSPLVMEAQANRDQSQAVINVINTSDAPIRVRVYTEPFTYSRDTGFQPLQSNSNDLSPYVQLSPRELTVLPGVPRRVRLLTRFSPSLPDGEYRAVVFTETLTESPDSKGGLIGIATRVGTTVYIRKGNVSPNLAVDSASFNTAQKQIQLLVRNTGQASARPTLTWKLKQGETVVKTGKLEPTTIVAQGDRNLSLNNPGQDQPALSSGDYQLTGELTWSEGNNSGTLPFNVKLTIPTYASTSSSQ